MNELQTVNITAIDRLERLVQARGNPAYHFQAAQFLNYLQDAVDGELSPETIEKYFQLKVDYGYIDKKGKQRTYKVEGLRAHYYAIKNILRLTIDHSPDLSQTEKYMLEKWLSDLKVPKVAKGKKQIGEEKVLSLTEIRRLIEDGGKTALLIEFLVSTGCRISEALGIKLEHCRTNGHAEITVFGKGSSERDVRISKAFYDRIRDTYRGKTYLFETSAGHAYNRSYIYRRIRLAGERLLGRPIYPHMMRHTFISRMLEENPGDLAGISAYAGHADPSITARLYVHGKLGFEKLNGFHDKIKGNE